ncbi:hypothetical protein COCNU_scaffold002779G000020 [Cocos nucifera]|nr:hypothetical protein [Cocos nucifera]
MGGLSRALWLQVLKEVKKQEEMVDSSKRWNAQVNSDKRIGSSSSAPVSEEPKLGETAPFLPKRRRGGHDDNENGDGRSQEKPVDKDMTAKPKARAKASSSQVENNCTSADGGDNKGSDGVMVNGNIGSNGKKRRSPAVLMEGSRCSRVNGRGWRCSQQTLVGYSLCEHHLGKGRLRSMSSVRGPGSSSKPKKSTEGGGSDGVLPLSSTTQEDEKNIARDHKQPLGGDNEVEDMEEKQEKKKRKKIGMVKARTISSLLDETNHSVSPSPSSSSAPVQLPSSVQSHHINGSETIV